MLKIRLMGICISQRESQRAWILVVCMLPCDLRWLFLFGGLVSLLFSSSVISIHSGGMGTACADHCIQIQYKYMLGVTQRDS